MKVIINCDDFGISERVSQEILSVASDGLITSTTCVVNHDYDGRGGHFLALAQTDISIGLHFNITEGFAISRDSKSDIFVSPDYNFNQKFFKKRFFLPTPERYRFVNAEFDAQFDRFVGLMGVKPTHVDSHHGSHHNIIILLFLVANLKRKGLRVVRRERNVGYISPALWVYKLVYRMLFRLAKLRSTDFFGSKRLVLARKFSRKGSVEVMCHVGSKSGCDEYSEPFCQYPEAFSEFEKITFKQI